MNIREKTYNEKIWSRIIAFAKIHVIIIDFILYKLKAIVYGFWSTLVYGIRSMIYTCIELKEFISLLLLITYYNQNGETYE